MGIYIREASVCIDVKVYNENETHKKQIPSHITMS